MPLWGSGEKIKNKYPASIRDLESKLGGPLVDFVDNTVASTAVGLIINFLPKSGILGVTYGALVLSVKAGQSELLAKCKKLKSGKYRGVRYVQEFDEGPIYGSYEQGSHYYELY
ncbi:MULTISPECIES: hypothetical protein [unclassified Clostridium]|uniref:hypothetical protein n=1 Tax=Clostridium TaxID=1485 RepID=UPI002079B097|nr:MULTISPECIES: hypothetical protein [unclassified Clostridium]